MIRIGILGANGRMGSMVERLLDSDEFRTRASLAARADLGTPVEPLFASDVVIDFSSPDAMVSVAAAAFNSKAKLPAFVVGSTGWSAPGQAVLDRLAMKTPVLVSSNFSTGVLALLHVLRQASPLLKKLGYAPVILDSHHQHKKDAPSGTALALQQAIGGAVQTHSVRAGETVGDHEVSFYGPADKLVFGHFAQDRSIFARGAIECALWLAGGAAKPGKTVSIEDYFAGVTK